MCPDAEIVPWVFSTDASADTCCPSWTVTRGNNVLQPSEAPNNSITEKSEPTPNVLPTGWEKWEEGGRQQAHPNLITGFKGRVVNTVLAGRLRMTAVSLPSETELSYCASTPALCICLLPESQVSLSLTLAQEMKELIARLVDGSKKGSGHLDCRISSPNPCQWHEQPAVDSANFLSSSKLDKRSQLSLADECEVRDPKEVLKALPFPVVELRSMSPGHAEAGSNHTNEDRCVESTVVTSGN